MGWKLEAVSIPAPATDAAALSGHLTGPAVGPLVVSEANLPARKGTAPASATVVGLCSTLAAALRSESRATVPGDAGGHATLRCIRR